MINTTAKLLILSILWTI